jgi:DNA-binding response OmpR family regulator
MAFNRIPMGSRQLVGDRRLTVLVGDPDADINYILRQVTPPDMYRMDESLDANELSERLRWFDVALMVVDVAILKSNKALCEHVRFQARLGVALIVTSEGEDPADEVLARSLGCVLYAPKPCGYWMLHQAVTEVLCQPALK